MGKLIAPFNQTKFMQSLLDVKNPTEINATILGGVCTVLSALFIRCVWEDYSLPKINEYMLGHQKDIVLLQTSARQAHQKGLNGYDMVLKKLGLVPQGGEAVPISSFVLNAGETVLHNFKTRFDMSTNSWETHTIAHLYHKGHGVIYTFDPNLGLFAESPKEWNEWVLRDIMCLHYSVATGSTFLQVKRG